MAKYYGHATKLDGTHIPLTNEEAGAIVEQSRQTKARRDEAMPETESALNQFMDAWIRLGELGWRSGILLSKGWHRVCRHSCGKYGHLQWFLLWGMAQGAFNVL